MKALADRPSVVIATDDELVWDLLELVCLSAGFPIVARVLGFGELLLRSPITAYEVLVTADRLGERLLEEALPSLLRAGHRVVVLSGDPSPERLSRLLAAEVCGYLSHATGLSEIVGAILAVARGEPALDPEALGTVLRQWRRLRVAASGIGAAQRPSLTPRELDILTAMCDGLAVKAIAARLGIAGKTVENHKVRVFEKLGVRSQAHAVTVALAYGLAVAPATKSEPDDDR